ncbi:MAG: nucleotide exchange factor GrpE [Chloracidobacterium sp. CP2_5A]|nr:MAG: nucleotide exchange factor GrpE [Chloracidobacterium sp. CP2_5A]
MSDESRETTETTEAADATVPVVRVTDKRRLSMEIEESGDDSAADARTASLADPQRLEERPSVEPLQMKIEELQMKLEEREAQLARLRAQVVEFESKTQDELRETRRRLERVFEQRVTSARQTLIEELLAVFDNLDLMLAGAENATRDDLLTGIAAMQRLLLHALQRQDIERVEALGQPFDPQLHEAVETASVGPEQDGRVVAQTRPGYRMAGRLIRPALVSVGRAEPSSAVLSETEVPA